MVADNESGESLRSNDRTSSGMFLSKAQDGIVADIEDRIASWTFLPPENGEAIQILRYELGQKYEPHFNYFEDEVNQELGGHRVATVLMYLSDVKKGGETVFTDSELLAMEGSIHNLLPLMLRLNFILTRALLGHC
ncbi:hypothetical protein SAY87_005217 [Trapa incisa]|uniref:Prolyl 4-hydroxylase alpha subunit domain-containing protein n=1 Tax=Trapa incisa TaxID=236973 RepID=A0AAN7Q785_9MYRT|nr:hypothetical protein SAY87_005217 [Trapa incisa]